MLFTTQNSIADSISVIPSKIYQGKSFFVYYRPSQETSVATITFQGKTIPFYKSENGLRAIIGVSPMSSTGNKTIEIQDDSGRVIESSIFVRKFNFLGEKLLFSAAKKGRLFSDKIMADQDVIASVLTIESPEQLWIGRFLRPIKGQLTSAFGSLRLYNGKRLGDHRGVDIGGNKVGAPIMAANNGIVVFSRLMPTIGSAAVIDHGQGVMSIYMHMSKTKVRIGDHLKKGDILGYIGNTGLSTGPHLHFGVSVHGVRVDPLEWIKRDN